jgi:hypothetical protein
MKLLNRVAKVTIGNRIFENPLRVEIEQQQAFQKFAATTVTLLNPNPDTIGACQSIDNPDNPDKPIRAQIVVSAGYRPNDNEEMIENVVTGEVMAFKVEPNGPDKALVIEVSDVGLFRAGINNYTSKQPNTASQILKFVSAGFNTNIRVGEEAYLDKYVIRDGLNAVKQYTRLTKSTWWFRGGKLNVIPASLTPRQPTELGPGNGLLARPKKIETGKKNERGYEVRTIYYPGVGVGSSIRVPVIEDGKERLVDGVVYESKLSVANWGSTNRHIHKMRPAA